MAAWVVLLQLYVDQIVDTSSTGVMTSEQEGGSYLVKTLLRVCYTVSVCQEHAAIGGWELFKPEKQWFVLMLWSVCENDTLWYAFKGSTDVTNLLYEFA